MDRRDVDIVDIDIDQNWVAKGRDYRDGISPHGNAFPAFSNGGKLITDERKDNEYLVSVIKVYDLDTESLSTTPLSCEVL